MAWFVNQNTKLRNGFSYTEAIDAVRRSIISIIKHSIVWHAIDWNALLYIYKIAYCNKENLTLKNRNWKCYIQHDGYKFKINNINFLFA